MLLCTSCRKSGDMSPLKSRDYSFPGVTSRKIRILVEDIAILLEQLLHMGIMNITPIITVLQGAEHSYTGSPYFTKPGHILHVYRNTSAQPSAASAHPVKKTADPRRRGNKKEERLPTKSFPTTSLWGARSAQPKYEQAPMHSAETKPTKIIH